jgi:hypothetical protein
MADFLGGRTGQFDAFDGATFRERDGFHVGVERGALLGKRELPEGCHARPEHVAEIFEIGILRGHSLCSFLPRNWKLCDAVGHGPITHRCENA